MPISKSIAGKGNWIVITDVHTQGEECGYKNKSVYFSRNESCSTITGCCETEKQKLFPSFLKNLFSI